MDFEKDLAEFAENDLKELLDSDYYAEALRAAGELDFNALVDGSFSSGSPGVVLNDRLITEASMGLISHLGSLTPLSNFFSSTATRVPSSIPIKTEHSYSMCEKMTEASVINTIEDDLSDLESECYPAISITEAEGSRAAQNKDPLFLPLKPTIQEDVKEEDIDIEEDVELEEFNLKRHPSVDTLSCCGDCSSCRPDCVLDFGDSLPSSPFPLADFRSSEDDAIMVATSPHNSQNQRCESEETEGSGGLFSPHPPLTPQGQDDQEQQPAHHHHHLHYHNHNHNYQNRRPHQHLHHRQSQLEDSSASDHKTCPSHPHFFSLASSDTNNLNEKISHQKKESKCSSPELVSHTSTNSTNQQQTTSNQAVSKPPPPDGGESINSAVFIHQNSTNGRMKETGFVYPPTPPSCSGSDSESGDYSPTRCNPLYERINPPLCNSKKVGPVRTSSRNPIHTHLISSQPKGATGTLYLTEEEKRTLISEGYEVPSKLPLTKAEEKSLKKIRRKIKNKISAQESRRKKKEYMDTLEHKVDLLTQENSSFRRKIESLQHKNNQLLQELERLKSSVEQGEKGVKRSTPRATIVAS